jgi:hypothetical protein
LLVKSILFCILVDYSRTRTIGAPSTSIIKAGETVRKNCIVGRNACDGRYLVSTDCAPPEPSGTGCFTLVVNSCKSAGTTSVACLERAVNVVDVPEMFLFLYRVTGRAALTAFT